MINAPSLAYFMFEYEGRSCATNSANSDRERAKFGRKIVGLRYPHVDIREASKDI